MIKNSTQMDAIQGIPESNGLRMIFCQNLVTSGFITLEVVKFYITSMKMRSNFGSGVFQYFLGLKRFYRNEKFHW